MTRHALLVLVGCASTVPPARPAQAVVAAEPAPTSALVRPGESMQYAAKLRGIEVARVAVAVGDAGWIDGRRAVILRSRGHSEGALALFTELTWELTTTLDVERGSLISNVEEAWLSFAGEKNHERDEHGKSDGVHDLHSAACLLRGWRAPQNEGRSLEVAVGGAEIPISIWQAARGEWIGDFPAVRFDGEAFGKYRFAIWLSDDADRVPLRVHAATKWGDVDIELVDYEPSRPVL